MSILPFPPRKPPPPRPDNDNRVTVRHVPVIGTITNDVVTFSIPMEEVDRMLGLPPRQDR